MFTLYALDHTLGLDGTPTAPDIEAAIKDHVQLGEDGVDRDLTSGLEPVSMAGEGATVQRGSQEEHRLAFPLARPREARHRGKSPGQILDVLLPRRVSQTERISNMSAHRAAAAAAASALSCPARAWIALLTDAQVIEWPHLAAVGWRAWMRPIDVSYTPSARSPRLPEPDAVKPLEFDHQPARRRQAPVILPGYTSAGKATTPRKDPDVPNPASSLRALPMASRGPQ